MTNTLLGLLLQFLLMLMRQHFYPWLHQPNRLNVCSYMGFTSAKDKTASIYIDIF